MTKVNIRTVTGFLNNLDSRKMVKIIDNIGKIEKICKVRKLNALQ